MIVNNNFITFVIILINSFSCFSIVDDTIKINNNQIYSLDKLDTLELIACLSNYIVLPSKYKVIGSSDIEVTKGNNNKFWVFVNSDNSLVSEKRDYLTIKRRYSFKKKTIAIRYKLPPKPRIVLGNSDLNIINNKEILFGKQLLNLKPPWTFKDSDAIKYRLDRYDIIINDALKIRAENGIFDFKSLERINLVEIKNIKYALSGCANLSYSDSILFK